MDERDGQQRSVVVRHLGAIDVLLRVLNVLCVANVACVGIRYRQKASRSVVVIDVRLTSDSDLERVVRKVGTVHGVTDAFVSKRARRSGSFPLRQDR